MDVDFELHPKDPIPTNLRAVEGGQAFKWDGKLYIKLTVPKELKNKEFSWNAIRISTGELVVLNPTEAVELRYDAVVYLTQDAEEA